MRICEVIQHTCDLNNNVDDNCCIVRLRVQPGSITLILSSSNRSRGTLSLPPQSPSFYKYLLCLYSHFYSLSVPPPSPPPPPPSPFLFSSVFLKFHLLIPGSFPPLPVIRWNTVWIRQCYLEYLHRYNIFLLFILFKLHIEKSNRGPLSVQLKSIFNPIEDFSQCSMHTPTHL